jgi:non-specific serine/threonine protein kinase
LSWAIERGQAELALCLGAALYRYWGLRGHFAEARRWLEQALALDTDDGPVARPRATALLGLADICFYQGDYATGKAYGHDALARFQSLGDTAGIATAHDRLGHLARASGDLAGATAHGEEALGRFRALGDHRRVAVALTGLGLAAYYDGANARAKVLHEEALALRRVAGDLNGLVVSLGNLGLVIYTDGDWANAEALHQEAMSLARSLDRKVFLAHCLENIALTAAARGASVRAVRLFGAADALRNRIGAPPTPCDRAYNNGLLAEARARLGDALFDAAWAESQAMPLEAAIDYALANDPIDAREAVLPA